MVDNGDSQKGMVCRVAGRCLPTDEQLRLLPIRNYSDLGACGCASRRMDCTNSVGGRSAGSVRAPSCNTANPTAEIGGPRQRVHTNDRATVPSKEHLRRVRHNNKVRTTLSEVR